MRRTLLLFVVLFLSQGCYLFSQQGWFWQNPLPQGNSLVDVCFLDANTGWAIGQHGTIIKTTNGGMNWNIQTSGTTVSLYKVNFIDENKGWAVGDYGVIIKTLDGGIMILPPKSTQ